MNLNPSPDHPHPITAAYFFDRLANVDDVTVMVDKEDFEAAQRELNASVPLSELRRYELIRSQFEDSSNLEDELSAELSFTVDDRVAAVSSKKKTNGVVINGNSIHSSDGSGLPQSTLNPPPVSVKSDQESDDEFFVANSNPDQDVKGKGKAT